MTCPRCGNEWDVTKSPCSRCGLTVRLPSNMRSGARKPPSVQNQPPPVKRPISGEPITPPPAVAPSMNQREFFGSGGAPVENSSVEQKSGPMSEFGSFSSPNFPKLQNTTTGSMESKLPQSDTLHRPPSGPLTPWPSARGSEPQKNVPPRPQSMGQTRNVVSEASLPGLRVKRLVTNADKEERSIGGEGKAETRGSSFSPSGGMVSSTPPLLLPGTILRNNRYQLREMLNRQEWQEGIYEATWQALDAQRGGAQVSMTELVLPENNSMATQSTLRMATMILTSVGRHPHVPTLWDAFSDHGRNFFVFEPIEGESLSMRMRRTGRAIAEQEVIECALQILDVLELLSQQLPPLVHGLIRPEHIIIGRNRNQYDLVNFSIILAGGATQYISNLERARLSPYMSPDFIHGVVDARGDLYSLVATMYHAATGSVPSITSAIGNVPPAQHLNPLVSAQLNSILSKGLQSTAAQRYQRPSELRQDLLALQGATSGGMPPRFGPASTGELSFSQLVQAQYPTSNADSVAQMLPTLLSNDMDNDDQERKLLLPRPEDLAPMSERNDTRLSLYWLVGILVCLTLLVVFSRVLS